MSTRRFCDVCGSELDPAKVTAHVQVWISSGDGGVYDVCNRDLPRLTAALKEEKVYAEPAR